MTQPSSSKLPALTGIRIFAALAVYMSHIGAPAGSPRLVAAFFEAGYAGVTLFFVLSGFVLALNYFNDFRRLNPRAGYGYFVARFARIYPLYVLVLFCLVVIEHASGQSIEGWWRNALAIQAWDPNLAHAYSFDGPAWSISVEFFLYACFPLLVPVLARLKQPHATLVVAIGVTAAMLALAALFATTGRSGLPWEDPGSAHRWLYRMPLTRLGDFTLGILAARLYVQTQGRESVKRLGSPLALGAAIMGLGLMAWPALLFSSWSWDVAYAVPAAAFIFGLAIAPRGLPARALSLSFLVLLGEASYAFYLVHAPAIDLLGGGRWEDSASITAVAFEGLMLGLILALAVGLYRAVERPARTYIRRVLLTRRTHSKPAADPASP